MSRHALDDESLRQALRSPGYQPARAHIGELFDRLATKDEDAAEAAERALARLGSEAIDPSLERFPQARPPARARICRLVGRLAQTCPADRERLLGFLTATLDDQDKKSRRHAALALGKLGGTQAADALLAALDKSTHSSPDEQRSLVEALGKVGGSRALGPLEKIAAEDRELARVLAEAKLRLRRTALRTEDESRGSIDGSASPQRRLPVLIHCRHGLAKDVAAELGPELEPKIVRESLVAAKLSGALDSLFRARTALRFSFPLETGGKSDPAEALIHAMTSNRAREI
ncbi:MAG: HEAT repeat domain-containing protein, partial [Polyangiaceae bacterium]|nr:HEAT repeat domain-containing protein [Polyangiaceae bacterium]